MTKSKLINTAKQLNQVENFVYDEFRSNYELLLSKINDKMLNRKDLHSLIGSENVDMMKDNHANHLRFMASVFNSYNPEVLVDTVLWVFRAYQSHGFSSNYWAAQLYTWILILKDALSKDAFSQVYPYYEWMQVNIPLFTDISQTQIDLQKSKH
jgi:hypothetical protein